jgi:hypothetical protein
MAPSIDPTPLRFCYSVVLRLCGSDARPPGSGLDNDSSRVENRLGNANLLDHRRCGFGGPPVARQDRLGMLPPSHSQDQAVKHLRNPSSYGGLPSQDLPKGARSAERKTAVLYHKTEA